MPMAKKRKTTDERKNALFAAHRDFQALLQDASRIRRDTDFSPAHGFTRVFTAIGIRLSKLPAPAGSNRPFPMFSRLFPNFSDNFQTIGNLSPFHFRLDDPPSARNMLRRREGAGGRVAFEKPVVFFLTKKQGL